MNNNTIIPEYSIDSKYSILGNLYYLLKQFKVIKSNKKFIELLCDDSFDKCESLWSLIGQKDYLPSGPYEAVCEKLKKKEPLLNDIEQLLSPINAENIDYINNALKIIIKEKTTYADRHLSNISYNERELERLREYYNRGIYSISYNIYLLIYLAVTKELPLEFYYGRKYREDLDEFNKEVISRYGVQSPSGARAILRLALSGNIVAMYEYADILYYGKTPSSIPNYKEAFEFFKRSAGLDYKYDINRDSCNPLAVWCLAYMHYNYHYRLDLVKIEPIPDLERMSKEDRIDAAINLAQKSYTLNNNVTAANLLGVIGLHEGEEIRKKYKLDEPEKYFNYAAKNGYVFAYNNLATIALNKAFNDPDNKEEYVKDYIYNLNCASERYCNWSSNKLGLFFLNGVLEREVYTEIEKDGKVEKVKSTETVPFPNYKDSQKAKEYFLKACEYELDASSAWAYANLIVSFKEEYDDYEDIPLMTEHINRVIRLRNKSALEHIKKHLVEQCEIIEKCEEMNK